MDTIFTHIFNKYLFDQIKFNVFDVLNKKFAF